MTFKFIKDADELRFYTDGSFSVIEYFRHDHCRNFNYVNFRKWCESGAKGDIVVYCFKSYGQTSTFYHFYFSDKVDLIAFKLKWGGQE